MPEAPLSNVSADGRLRRAPLAVLLFASTLGVLGGAIVAPVLEVIRDDLNVSGTQAGLIITTHGLAMAVLGPLVGRVFDRWGSEAPWRPGSCSTHLVVAPASSPRRSRH